MTFMVWEDVKASLGSWCLNWDYDRSRLKARDSSISMLILSFSSYYECEMHKVKVAVLAHTAKPVAAFPQWRPHDWPSRWLGLKVLPTQDTALAVCSCIRVVMSVCMCVPKCEFVHVCASGHHMSMCGSLRTVLGVFSWSVSIFLSLFAF